MTRQSTQNKGYKHAKTPFINFPDLGPQTKHLELIYPSEHHLSVASCKPHQRAPTFEGTFMYSA